ncbi:MULTISPECIES: DUF305 domain-containing protein [unclassified Massilia]|uniref:DUF305 domain-containing protein n=1 Tax=unclassified Massilia TaxID=2609279 RepID=UPI001E300BD9|nr:MULTISPECIES: DUF305 domain-containing protein [unclassified Massilia]
MKTKPVSRTNSLIGLLVTGILVASAALASATAASAQSMAGMQHDMKSTASDSSMKMHMTMQENQKKMNDMQMSGDIDRDFAMMMRAHHQAGIDMAKVEAESGKNPEMVKEAKKIIASQQKDIQKFDSWLQKHPNK